MPRISAVALTATLIASGATAQVIPDGSSATHVTLNPNGSVTVGIAPATANGVSLNRYSDFNVPAPGVQLDNRTQAARTIVNEVTGALPTDINGPLEVLGQRAHVIVANPNGITIDGGRFVNTGRVALSTGAISSTSRQIAPGIFQENVTSSVTGGVITVTGDGLSGQMDAVDLIAHQIRVNGLAQNTEGSLQLHAGQSTTEFNSAILPGNTGAGWANVTGAGASADGAVLIEIARPGVLRAGRIGIEVSDKGAGVRMAGDGFATAHDFTLRADGQIALDGARITAANDISMHGTGALSARDAQVAALGHLELRADQVTLEDASQFAAETGSLSLITAGTHSDGSFTNSGSTLRGAGSDSMAAVTLNVTGDLRNQSTEDLAIIFGTGGDVLASAGGDIDNTRGRILANGDIEFDTPGTLRNLLEAPADAVDPVITAFTREGSRQWWTLWIKRKRETYLAYDYGTLAGTDQLPTITATGSVTIHAGTAMRNQGGEINANGGDLQITAPQVETIGLGSGKTFLHKTCVIGCFYESGGNASYHGGQMNAAGNISITAADHFVSKAGSVLAMGNVDITSPDAEIEAALLPTLVTRPKGLYSFWRSKAAWVFLRDQFGAIIAETGKITITSDRPVQIKGGSLTAAGGVDLASGQDIVRAPRTPSGRPAGSIGFFADLPLIGR